MTCVGIVGGLGVGATVHYYEKIAAACTARGVIPDLVFVHADANKGHDHTFFIEHNGAVFAD